MAEVPHEAIEEVQRWSLRQLFERFVLQHPDVIESWTEAIVAYERVPYDLSFDEIFSLLPTAQWTLRLDAGKLVQQIIYTTGHPIEGKAESALWLLLTKYNAMIDLLRAGFLKAEAIGANTDKARSISPDLWWSGKYVLNLETSALLARDPNGLFDDFRELKLSRALRRPDQFDGLSLSDAFREAVLWDAGVRCVAHYVEEESHIDARHAVMGVFWSGQDHHTCWWPVALAHRGQPLPSGSDHNETLFVAAIADRIRQFLAPLRAGDVVAKGLNLSDQPLSIPRTVWGEEETCIHSFEHSIGRLGEGKFVSVSGVDIRFQNVELEVKNKTKHVPRSPELSAGATSDAETQRPESSNRTAPHQKLASDAKIERLLRSELQKPYRPKSQIISDIVSSVQTSNRRVLRIWDAIVPAEFPERTQSGPRKKS